MCGQIPPSIYPTLHVRLKALIHLWAPVLSTCKVQPHTPWTNHDHHIIVNAGYFLAHFACLPHLDGTVLWRGVEETLPSPPDTCDPVGVATENNHSPAQHRVPHPHCSILQCEQVRLEGRDQELVLPLFLNPSSDWPVSQQIEFVVTFLSCQK